MKKEFTHELLEKFKYSNKGQFEDADIIVVTAPKTQDFYTNLAFLDSLYLKAERRSFKDVAGLMKELDLTDDQKEKIREEETAKQDGLTDDDKALNAYSQLIAGLEQKEIQQLDICICELLKSSAKVNGDKYFETTFFENDLSFEDRRLLTGKYVVNFTSAFQRNLKNA